MIIPLSSRTTSEGYRRFWAVVPGPVLLWLTIRLLPAGYLDHGRSLCFSRLLLNRECPGCGMGRACFHAVHFDWCTAWQYNRLFVVVLPLLAYLWGKEVLDSSRRLGWINR